jgi:hypothetical protein
VERESLLLKPGVRRQLGAAVFLIILNLALAGTSLRAEPPAKTKSASPARARIIESANGWTRVNGEWIHPEGYKFVNNKVVRSTAKTGRAFPKPPGKLALENAAKLESRTKAPSAADDAQTPAEKAAETRRKNLTPTAAPQTGTHL